MIAERAYKAIFFDADDTLFDYPLAERVALATVRRHFRIQIGEETLVAAYRRINSGLRRAYERKEVRQEDIPLARFQKLIADLTLDHLNAQALSDSYLDALARQSQLLDGALELAATLAPRYTLVLITDGIARVQRPRFQQSSLLPYFSGIVISEEAGALKPDPRILWPALSHLNLSPLEILMVGDSISSDLTCARAVGADFCWFNPNQEPLPEGPPPTYVIAALPELLHILLPA